MYNNYFRFKVGIADSGDTFEFSEVFNDQSEIDCKRELEEFLDQIQSAVQCDVLVANNSDTVYITIIS